MPYDVYVIKADGSMVKSTQAKVPDLEQCQAAVGGSIETVPYFKSLGDDMPRRGTAFANENGLMFRLPPNKRASDLWRKNFEQSAWQMLRCELVGDVIFYIKVK